MVLGGLIRKFFCFSTVALLTSLYSSATEIRNCKIEPQTVDWSLSEVVNDVSLIGAKLSDPKVDILTSNMSIVVEEVGSQQPSQQISFIQKSANSDVPSEIVVNIGRKGEGVDQLLFDVAGESVGAVAVEAYFGEESVDLKVARTGDESSRLTMLSETSVDTIKIYFSPDASGGLSLGPLTYCPTWVSVKAQRKLLFAEGSVKAKLPGAELISVLNINNYGTGWVDKDTIVVIDEIQAGLTFFNGDIDGDGPLKGAVSFIDRDSGLIFQAERDVKFSNSLTKPSNLDGCKYSPKSGYDPEVRFVCIQPKGYLKGSKSGAGFDLAYKTIIN